jgi:hypothetical protein
MSTSAIAEDYGKSFLRIGVGPRAMGMGGAFISLADDGTAAYWNPAGLAQIRVPHVMAAQTFLFKSLADHNFVNATLPLKNDFAIGVSWMRLEVDDIPQFSARVPGRTGTNLQQEPGANLQKDTEQAYFISLAKQYKYNLGLGPFNGVLPIEMPVAINLKYIRQSIDSETSQGYGLDFGYMIKVGLKDAIGYENAGHITMGITARDLIGTRIHWDTRRDETIDPSFRMGFSITQSITPIQGTLIISEQHNLYNSESFRLGMEYWHHNLLAIRIGYGDHFTTGAGFIIRQLMFDYAFFNEGNGGTHYFSAGFNY